MTWRYVFVESVGPGETIQVHSVGGFPSSDVAMAEGTHEATRIASLAVHPLKGKVFTVDVREEQDDPLQALVVKDVARRPPSTS